MCGNVDLVELVSYDAITSQISTFMVQHFSGLNLMFQVDCSHFRSQNLTFGVHSQRFCPRVFSCYACTSSLLIK